MTSVIGTQCTAERAHDCVWTAYKPQSELIHVHMEHKILNQCAVTREI